MIKSDLWKQFCEDPTTENYLRVEARNFVEQFSSISLSSDLQLDNRWHYLTKEKRFGYRGTQGKSINGTPYINLTFNDFRHGGSSETFNSKEVLDHLFQDYKLSNITYTESYKKRLADLQLRQKARQKAIEDRKLLEEQNKKRSVEKDLQLFQKLSISGNSDYLNKKGFPNIENNSLRYAKSFVAALITDIEGNARGLQKIYDNCPKNEQKQFTYGLQKEGAFVQLNDIGKNPRFAVCEGITTGLSILTGIIYQLATATVKIDIPTVICSLDAGNIQPVIAALRSKYGNCEIVIYADDDQWKANKINPKTNKPLGNTGLIKAHQTALKFNCLVSSPNFFGLDLSTKPTDFNDLHSLAGIKTLAKQLEIKRKPDPYYAFAKTRENAQERNRKLFKGHRHIYLNDRYLMEVPDEQDGTIRLLPELIAQHGVTIIRSPIGTGKTEVCKTLTDLNRSNSIAYVTHLVSLISDAATRLNLEHYQDYIGQQRDTNLARLNELPHLAICVNSLPKLKDPRGFIRSVDTLIIDECEQLFRRLTTDIDYKNAVIGSLTYLVKRAKHVICMDAHISKVTEYVLNELRPNEEYLYILNELQPHTDKEVLFYNTHGELLDAANKELENGGKTFLVFNCKNKAKDFYELTSKLGHNILYVSGDNSGDIAVKEFYDNPNEVSKKYDGIIASPAICTGISINNEYFTFVGGVFDHGINPAMDCVQALGRVRNSKLIHTYISPAKELLPTNSEQILKSLLELASYDDGLASVNHQTGQVEINEFYQGLYCRVKAEENYSKINIKNRILELLDSDGYKISYADSTNETVSTGRFIQKTAKELGNHAYIEEIANEIDLTAEQAEKLQRKSKRTAKETAALRKYEIKEFYNISSTDSKEKLIETIELDKKGRTREKVENLELALSSESQSSEKYQEQKQAGKELVPDRRAFAAEREFFMMLLFFVGIESLESQNKTYNREDILSSDFFKKLTTNLEKYKASKIIPYISKTALEENPIRFIGKCLSVLGLAHHRVGRNENNNYQIDVGRLAMMREIILVRGKILQYETSFSFKQKNKISVPSQEKS